MGNGSGGLRAAERSGTLKHLLVLLCYCHLQMFERSTTFGGAEAAATIAHLCAEHLQPFSFFAYVQ